MQNDHKPIEAGDESPGKPISRVPTASGAHNRFRITGETQPHPTTPLRGVPTERRPRVVLAGLSNALPAKALRCLSKFPPPLIGHTSVDVKGMVDLDAIVKSNAWSIDVFSLTPDDCLLLIEKIYKDLGYLKAP